MKSSKKITCHSNLKKVNLSKSIFNKIIDFIRKQMDLKDFEQWIYTCDELSDELEYDEYLKLIGFNFHSKDAYYSLNKILKELLNNHTVEQTNEIVISGLNISDTVYDMLLEGKIVGTVKERNEIIKIFEEEGIPVFDKVIDFQEQFSGISFKIGKTFYKGFEMNLLCFDAYKGKYVLNYVTKKDGKFFFECMDFYFGGDIGPFIDEDGKIYDFCMGNLFLCADSIEEFLEDEAVKYYFVSNNDKWLNRGTNMIEINEFKRTNSFHKIEKESFSGKYFEWWCDEETVFIRIDLTRKYSYAELYCKDQNVLKKLYNADKSAIVFPSEY